MPGPGPASRPILVVDDDVKIVRLVRTYLERAGYRVVEATDGRTALSAIALEAPALVVLDVMLPEVDGLAVLRAVRRTDRTPVIIVSARGLTSRIPLCSTICISPRNEVSTADTATSP